jgi:hypothetical protein
MIGFLMKLFMRIAFYRSVYHTLKRIFVDVRARLAERRSASS